MLWKAWGFRQFLAEDLCWYPAAQASVRRGIHPPRQAHRKVRKGDTLHLAVAADGSDRLTPHNLEFARQMSFAEDIVHDDRDVLRALAKSAIWPLQCL